MLSPEERSVWVTRTKAGPEQIKKLGTFVNSLTSQWGSILLLQDYGASLSQAEMEHCAKAAMTEGEKDPLCVVAVTLRI